MFDVSDSMDVGQKNIDYVRQYIKKEGFTVKCGDLGGTYPRKIQYYPVSGRVRMKKLYRIHNDTIIRREIKYNEILSHVPPEGAVEIFK
jgi:chemotaxis protein CheD